MNIFDFEQLIKEIRTAVRSEFEIAQKLYDQNNEADEIGGIELAVKTTGLAKPTIYGLCADHKIPHSKPSGKKLYFSKRELLEWLKSGKRRTQSELALEAETFKPTIRRKSIIAR